MARQEGGALVQLSIRLPQAMKQAAQREAQELGIPIAALVKLALSERQERQKQGVRNGK